MDRNLDGCYFRVFRNNKWKSVCFSDLTDDEMDIVLQGRDERWLKSLCKHLGHVIYTIGERYGIIRVD